MYLSFDHTWFIAFSAETRAVCRRLLDRQVVNLRASPQLEHLRCKDKFFWISGLTFGRLRQNLDAIIAYHLEVIVLHIREERFIYREGWHATCMCHRTGEGFFGSRGSMPCSFAYCFWMIQRCSKCFEKIHSNWFCTVNIHLLLVSSNRSGIYLIGASWREISQSESSMISLFAYCIWIMHGCWKCLERFILIDFVQLIFI